jgi:hypothetical protein
MPHSRRAARPPDLTLRLQRPDARVDAAPSFGLPFVGVEVARGVQILDQVRRGSAEAAAASESRLLEVAFACLQGASAPHVDCVLCGYLRIAGELRKLGIAVSASSMRNILTGAGLPPAAQRCAVLAQLSPGAWRVGPRLRAGCKDAVLLQSDDSGLGGQTARGPARRGSPNRLRDRRLYVRTDAARTKARELTFEALVALQRVSRIRRPAAASNRSLCAQIGSACKREFLQSGSTLRTPQDFLVQAGAGILVVEREERPFKQRALVHCAPENEACLRRRPLTDRSCSSTRARRSSRRTALLLVLTRLRPSTNASSPEDTRDGGIAYARFAPARATRDPGDQLPGALRDHVEHPIP